MVRGFFAVLWVLVLVHLMLPATGYSQSIKNIEGSRVTIGMESEPFEEGDEVHFLDSNLEVKALGIVEKRSPGGKAAIIRVTSGKVDKSLTLEKTSKATKNDAKGGRSDKVTFDRLSPEERKILADGEISTASYVIGGILGTYPIGLGVGHAIQGRFKDQGWIFLTGELVSLAAVIGGVSCTRPSAPSGYSYTECSLNTLGTLGIAGFIGFRIWEIVDVWAAPPEINRRYRDLKSRVAAYEISPALFATRDGAGFGMELRF